MKKYDTRRIDFNEEIYDFIVEYFKNNMLVPNIRQIVKGTSYRSNQTVHIHVRRMIEAGKLNQIGDRYCLPKDTVIEIIRTIESESD